MKNSNSLITHLLVVSLLMALQSCNQSSENEESNKATVIQANDELFNKGNVDYADNVFSSDYEPKGPDGIKNFVFNIRAAFPDLQVEIDPILADGDMVAWVRTNTGTQNGDLKGYKATGNKITWTDVVISRFNAEGKLSKEWGQTGLKEALETADRIEGVYEYLPPLKGQSIVRNGRFVFLFGSADDEGTMTSQAGTYTISGDTVENTLSYSTNPEEIGTKYWWRVKSWSGDTASFETMDENGQITGGGRSVRLSY